MSPSYSGLLRRDRIAGVLLLGLLLSCGGDDSGPQVPADIVITPNHPALGQGLDLQLRGTVVDASGHAIAGKFATFSSADTLVAKVTPGGLVHSVGPISTVHITAEFDGITNSVDLTVTQRVVRLSVLPESLILNRHLAAQLQVSPVDYLGQPVYVGGTVTFTSANPGLAAVDANGVVTANGADGRTTVRVSADTYQVVVPVRVKQIAAALTVSPANLLLAHSGTGDVTASVSDQHGDPITGQPIGYHSSAPGVFTVSASGHVTAGAADGSGILRVTWDTLESDVAVLVGNTSPGVLVHTTPLAAQAYEAAVGPGGKMAVSGVSAANVALGALPAYTFGTPLSVGGTAFGVAINHAETKAYVAEDGGVAVIDLASFTQTGNLTGFGGGTRFSVVVSADDQYLFVGADYGLYRINLSTGLPDDSLAITGANLFLALDPANPRLYSSVAYGGVQEITLGASMALGRTFAVSSPRGLAVAPDGSELYVTSESGSDLEVWNLTSGLRTQLASLSGAPGFGLALSANRIAVTCRNGAVKLSTSPGGGVVPGGGVGGAPALSVG